MSMMTIEGAKNGLEGRRKLQKPYVCETVLFATDDCDF